MNNSANYTSFQGVLDSIIRSYLLNELPPEVGESNAAANIRHSSAERDLGLSQAGIPIPPEILQSLRRTVQEQGFTNNDGQIPGTSAAASATRVKSSAAAANVDQEYIKALHQCFEKRGVFKELQTFLRHKLVSILQDEFPSLQQSLEAVDEQNITVFRLIEDFLRCHKLLYTLSVLASESDVKQQHTKVLHGKLNAKEAEDLLDELGIRRLSRLSGQVLKCYFDNEHFSLLESMHYLGIWLDGSANQPLSEMGQSVKKKGSGQSIFLTKSITTQTLTEKGEGCGRELDKENVGVGSVDRRLIELERRMEKEGVVKLEEAMERFKSEEIRSVREVLERKMNLELVQKEKEHLIELQSQLSEINKGIHQERQGWLEVKLRQEKELCELRKQLVTKTGKDISNTNLQQLEPLESPRMPSKSSQVSFKRESCCNCRKRNSSFEEDNEKRRGARFMPSSMHESTEQDKIAFLQYRLEQQDEEMKSLRRQLMVSQYEPAIASSSKAIKKSNEPRREERGGGDAEEAIPRNTHNSSGEDYANEKLDDLATFLRDTKKRMEKLDVAASKVDEIVQEVFAKKRAATPLSSELLSARLSSVRMRKTVGEICRVPGIYNVQSSPRLHSPMAFSSLAPLHHQQLPEKQVTFVSNELKKLPSYNNFDIFHRFPRRNIGGGSGQSPSYIAPSASSQVMNIMETLEGNRIEEERPQTPIDRQFPVSYGEKQQISVTPSGQANSRNGSNGRVRDPKLVKIFQAPTAREEEDSISEASSTPPSARSINEQLEESLFHMAAKNFENGSSAGKGSTNLKEKAIRHGALSKEKVVTSDDDENSRSISVSESIKLKLASKVKERMALRNNNGNGLKKNGALSKSKVISENEKAFVETVKAPRQGESSQAIRPSIKPSSSSSSSHSSRKAKLSRQENRFEQENDQNDLSVSSISISAPKSDNNGNGDDFWKL